MDMTQPKRRLTSSTQHGGHSSGSLSLLDEGLSHLSLWANLARRFSHLPRPQARNAWAGSASGMHFLAALPLGSHTQLPSKQAVGQAGRETGRLAS